jgi:hypothetical protein
MRAVGRREREEREGSSVGRGARGLRPAPRAPGRNCRPAPRAPVHVPHQGHEPGSPAGAAASPFLSGTHPTGRQAHVPYVSSRCP